MHYGSIAVVDTQGRLISALGDPDSLNFTRSALKPLQALPFVEDGGLGRYNFSSHELALMCASHSGEAIHISIVQRMLAAAGVDDTALQCRDRIVRACRREVECAVSQLLRQARRVSRLRPHARATARNLPRQRPSTAAAHPHDGGALRPG